MFYSHEQLRSLLVLSQSENILKRNLEKLQLIHENLLLLHKKEASSAKNPIFIPSC